MDDLVRQQLMIEEACRIQKARWDKNSRTIESSSINGSLLEELERSMLGWEPRDTRIQNPYNADLYEFDISEANGKLYQGTRLVKGYTVEEKGLLVLKILITSNLGDFEDYNKQVDAYNDGLSNLDDPVSGDPSTDVPVKHCGPDMQHDLGIEMEPGYLDEIPGVPRPVDEKVEVASIQMKIQEVRGRMMLEFVVQDSKAKIIYWGRYESDDLSQLTRKAIQGVFGNPSIEAAGDPLEGLPMLLRGEKAASLLTDPPGWAAGEVKTFAVNKEFINLIYLYKSLDFIAFACMGLGSIALFRSIFLASDQFIESLVLGFIVPVVIGFVTKIIWFIAETKKHKF
jgi:hypothetical protein